MPSNAHAVSFKVKHTGKWPPDISALSHLGFDKISCRKNSVLLSKTCAHGVFWKKGSIVQIELRADSAALRYPSSNENDSFDSVKPTILLLRTLSLVPGMSADLQSFSKAVLPAVETASSVASEPYESLWKKHSDLRAEHAGLISKEKRSARGSESNARRVIELEALISAQQARISRFETVSDASLRELISDWLSSHNGQFNMASFCRQTLLLPARCEEGLGLLLGDGSIAEVPGGYVVAKNSHARTFLPSKGIAHAQLSRMKSAFSLLASRILRKQAH